MYKYNALNILICATMLFYCMFSFIENEVWLSLPSDIQTELSGNSGMWSRGKRDRVTVNLGKEEYRTPVWLWALCKHNDPAPGYSHERLDFSLVRVHGNVRSWGTQGP